MKTRYDWLTWFRCMTIGALIAFLAIVGNNWLNESPPMKGPDTVLPNGYTVGELTYIIRMNEEYPNGRVPDAVRWRVDAIEARVKERTR